MNRGFVNVGIFRQRMQNF